MSTGESEFEARRFRSLQGWSRAFHRKEGQSQFDASFDEAVIL
jgi:hypothetical protein